MFNFTHVFKKKENQNIIYIKKELTAVWDSIVKCNT